MKKTRKNRTGKKRQESQRVHLTRMQRLLIKGLQEGKSLLQAALAAGYAPATAKSNVYTSSAVRSAIAQLMDAQGIGDGGARPSVGKSALLAGIAIQAAHRGFSSLIVNAEMVLVDVGTRMLARETHLENFDLRRGNVNQEDICQIVKASRVLSPLPVRMYDERRWEVIKTKILAMKVQVKDLAVVFIDYLTRIKVQPEQGEQRYQQIGRICREAKELAEDLQISVVVGAQLTRGRASSRFYSTVWSGPSDRVRSSESSPRPSRLS